MGRRAALTVIAAAAALASLTAARTAPPLFAQTALRQLGLTEAAARTFLFDEVKSPTDGANRRTRIAVTGHRAFYKLPPAARGPAATALFAWAKTYVNSPAFTTAYAQYRRDANPIDERPRPSVDEQLAAEMVKFAENLEMGRKIAASLPPADRDRALAQVKEQEARQAEFRENIRRGLEIEAAERAKSDLESGARFNERYPADPNEIVRRRLRQFLDETADADFAARIIRLTDGPDGMEFVSPADRAKSTIWQLAVLAGPEATGAARAAAEAWLKEIAP